jgi:hypothetical protein
MSLFRFIFSKARVHELSGRISVPRLAAASEPEHPMTASVPIRTTQARGCRRPFGNTDSPADTESRFGGNPVSFPPIPRPFAFVGYYPTELMADRYRRIHRYLGIPVADVKVRAAYTGGLYPNQSLPWMKLWHGTIPNFQITGSVVIV